MTKEKAQAIRVILLEVGLSDSVYAFNLPFTKKGKIAVIDTEYYHIWPVHLERLTNYFSSPMRTYWQSLNH